MAHGVSGEAGEAGDLFRTELVDEVQAEDALIEFAEPRQGEAQALPASLDIEVVFDGRGGDGFGDFLEDGCAVLPAEVSGDEIAGGGENEGGEEVRFPQTSSAQSEDHGEQDILNQVPC